jgi:PPP family 3-phenylpropionic acid transporter
VVLLMLVHVAMSVAMAPVGPLADAVTVAAVRRHGMDYGRVRSAGSVAFILAAVLAGLVVDRFGAAVSVLLMALGFAAAAGAALLLPPAEGRAPGGPRGLAGLFAPFAIPALRWQILVSALIQGRCCMPAASARSTWRR